MPPMGKATVASVSPLNTRGKVMGPIVFAADGPGLFAPSKVPPDQLTVLAVVPTATCFRKVLRPEPEFLLGFFIAGRL